MLFRSKKPGAAPAASENDGVPEFLQELYAVEPQPDIAEITRLARRYAKEAATEQVESESGKTVDSYRGRHLFGPEVREREQLLAFEEAAFAAIWSSQQHEFLDKAARNIRLDSAYAEWQRITRAEESARQHLEAVTCPVCSKVADTPETGMPVGERNLFPEVRSPLPHVESAVLLRSCAFCFIVARAQLAEHLSGLSVSEEEGTRGVLVSSALKAVI